MHPKRHARTHALFTQSVFLAVAFSIRQNIYIQWAKKKPYNTILKLNINDTMIATLRIRSIIVLYQTAAAAAASSYRHSV